MHNSYVVYKNANNLKRNKKNLGHRHLHHHHQIERDHKEGRQKKKEQHKRIYILLFLLVDFLDLT